MKRKVITGVIFGLVLLSLVMAAVYRDQPGTDQRTTGAKAGNAVGLIDVSGLIVSGGSGGGGFGGTVQVGSQTIISQLREAQEDPDIKAVVLRINSPGGSAAGSIEVGNEIQRTKEAGVVVVSYMADVAASGGYWIACETDRIVANPSTMTGSIGVIMTTMDLQGLYEMLGVDKNVFKSGPYKDMGAEHRDVTEPERAIFQSMVEDIYQQFVDVVVNGRDMEKEAVLELADGRVFTGRQAAELGLVDQVGDLHDAVQIAAEMAGIEDPYTVNLTPRTIWDELFWRLSYNTTLQLYGLDSLPYRPMLIPGKI